MAADTGDGLRHREEWIWLLPLIALALLAFAAAEVAGSAHDLSAFAILGDYGMKAVLALVLLVPFTLAAIMIRGIAAGSKSPLGDLAAPLRARFGTPMLVLAGLLPLVLMPVVLAAFGVLKQLMPTIVPFMWDDSFAAADRALFFGHQPWQLTHALFGPAATVAIDRLYTFWVAMLFLTTPGFAFLAPRYERARFFLSFAAAWILLGVVGAYAGASAGPCYTALIGASSAADFAPLMQRLHDYSDHYSMLNAVEWQNLLWDAHVNGRYGFAMGISAMPSLHNAIAVLYALICMRAGRGWAIAGWAFAGLVFLGSIHLGWHYAIDGLASAAAMTVIWLAIGRYLDWAGYAPAPAGPEIPMAEEPRPALA